jgi:hypothetical protein
MRKEFPMDKKFFRPNVIWSGIWFLIFLIIFSIATWQNRIYWEINRSRSQALELNMVHTLLPYVIAFLEEHQRPDLIKQIFNYDSGYSTLVYTDMAGRIKYVTPRAASPRKLDASILEKYKFSYVFKKPRAPQEVTRSGKDTRAADDSREPKTAPPAYGKLYLLDREPPALLETIWNKQDWQGIWHREAQSGYLFSIISYLFLLIGFAAICAITARYQNHFQEAQEEQYESELEARDLRIQVLESNLNTLDLRLQILDQEHEKALTSSNKVRKTIDKLEARLLTESSKNEELQIKLSKAQIEHDEALKTINLIDMDRRQIAAEKRELEALREVETQEYSGLVKQRTRPKEYLWLNLIYKNLYFSKRALQNIIELQNAHDIFPSLPDALSNINNSSLDSLTSGEGVPSRSVVRYTRPLHHFDGFFWEYRFSKDGRIFFGISDSRTWNIDTILLKRRFSDKKQKYDKYLENTLGKDNNDLKPY